jgi:hypothetical protein
MNPTPLAKVFNLDAKICHGSFGRPAWKGCYSTDYCGVYPYCTKNIRWRGSDIGYPPYGGINGSFWGGLPSPDWGLKLRKNVSSTKQGFNISGYVGEYAETAKLFKTVGLALVDVWSMAHGHFPKHTLKNLKKYTKNNVHRRRLSTKNLADVWLNTQFAVLPLANDLGESLVRLESDLNRPIRRRFHAKATEDFDNDWPVSPTSDTIWYTGHTHGFVRSEAIAYVEFETTWDDGMSFNANEAIWEGIPFSFLADYVFNVGEILGQLDAFKGVKLAAPISVTTREYVNSDGYISGYRSGSGRSLPFIREQDFALSYSSHKREVLGTFPELRLPVYKPSLGAKRVFNTLALLRTIGLTR